MGNQIIVSQTRAYQSSTEQSLNRAHFLAITYDLYQTTNFSFWLNYCINRKEYGNRGLTEWVQGYIFQGVQYYKAIKMTISSVHGYNMYVAYGTSTERGLAAVASSFIPTAILAAGSVDVNGRYNLIGAKHHSERGNYFVRVTYPFK